MRWLSAVLILAGCMAPAASPTASVPAATATAAPAVAASPAATAATPAATSGATTSVPRPAFLTIPLTDVRTGERFTLGGFQGKVVLGIAMAVW